MGTVERADLVYVAHGTALVAQLGTDAVVLGSTGLALDVGDVDGATVSTGVIAADLDGNGLVDAVLPGQGNVVLINRRH